MKFDHKFSLASFGTLALALSLPASSCAQSSEFRFQAGGYKNVVTIRGQKQYIYFYPATGTRLNRKVLFAPGDGGWRGWAVTIAQQMAGWGYDVYGLDTKTYLSSFTGSFSGSFSGGFNSSARLRESDVMSDFRQIALWINGGSGERVTLVGWSEGAGLGVLAAAAEENKLIFKGLITFGLEDINLLGWGWKDNISYITKSRPNEPTFRVSGYLGKISPLPYMMIQASRDEYVPPDETQMLAASAKEPKRIAIVQANNHRFGGNAGEFYRQLREGLQWIN